tara:strand:- start:982 stop:2571 length:1590 start_codon:yes stop_codon:yes gene_type:complete
MTTLDKNSDGGAMFKIKNQVKGIDFMHYSDDVKLITSEYSANDKNIAFKFEQIRKDYRENTPNRENAVKQLDLVYRATAWAKANDVKADAIKLKRGKILKGFDQTRIKRATYGEIGDSFLNYVDDSIFKVDDSLKMENLIKTTGNRDTMDYKAIYFEKVLGLLLKYASAFSTVFSSCGKCETVIDIVKQAIQQNVKPDCLVNPGDVSVSQRPSNMPMMPPPPSPPVVQPTVVEKPPENKVQYVDSKFQPVAAVREAGFSILDPIKYLGGDMNDSIVGELKRKITDKIQNDTTLSEEEKTEIKNIVMSIRVNKNTNEGVSELKSLMYIYIINQLDIFFTTIHQNNDLTSLLTPVQRDNLKGSGLFQELGGKLDKANNEDLKDSSFVSSLGRLGVGLAEDAKGVIGAQDLDAEKGRLDDRLRIFKEKPNRFSNNLDLVRKMITTLDLTFEEANSLLNKNSDLYNGIIKGSVGFTPEETRKQQNVSAYTEPQWITSTGGRRTRRQYKKKRSTFKRIKSMKNQKPKQRKTHKK